MLTKDFPNLVSVGKKKIKGKNYIELDSLIQLSWFNINKKIYEIEKGK